MGLTEQALGYALYMALNHVNRSGIIPKTAASFDKFSDHRLGLKGSERLQAQIVIQVLLPLARELMKEDPLVYQKALTDERSFISRTGGGGSLISGELGPIPGRVRSNVQAKNRRA